MFCYPYIHFLTLIRGRVTRAAPLAERPRLPSSQPLRSALQRKSWGIPMPAERHSLSKHVLSCPRGLLPMGRAHNTSLGRPPRGIRTRCPATSSGSFQCGGASRLWGPQHPEPLGTPGRVKKAWWDLFFSFTASLKADVHRVLSLALQLKIRVLADEQS